MFAILLIIEYLQWNLEMKQDRKPPGPGFYYHRIENM